MAALVPLTSLDRFPPELYYQRILLDSLTPGVYTVPSGTSNLTGTLTFNGQGNLNAFWVFQMPSTLITPPASVVNVINTGAGAGVIGTSAAPPRWTLLHHYVV